MTIAFDTLRAATRLREEAGFDESQARVLVDTLAEGLSESLATKVDLEKTETALRGEIADLRSDLEKTESALRSDLEKTESALRSDLEKTESALRGEIADLRSDLEKVETSLRSDLGKVEASLRGEMRELEQRMTIRLGGMMVVAVGIAAAAVRFL